MILVVMWHISRPLLTHPPTLWWLENVRMPVFFFISGFLSYTPAFEGALRKKKIDSRLSKQLWPSIVIFSIVEIMLLIIGDRTLKTIAFDIILDPGKNGYWFTLVLVEAFLIMAFIESQLRKYGASQKARTLTYIIIALSILTLQEVLRDYIASFDDSFKCVIFSLFSAKSLVLYLPAFLIGVLFKIHKELFFKIVASKYALLLCLAVALAFIVIGGPLYKFTYVPGCLLMIGMAYHFNSVFSSRSAIGRNLIHIGRNTLQIYLLHYLFIFFIFRAIPGEEIANCIMTLASSLGDGQLSAMAETVMYYALLIPVAWLTTMATLGIDRLLKRTGRLYDIIFDPLSLVRSRRALTAEVAK